MQHTQRWRPRPANTLRASVFALPTHSALASSPCQHTLSAGVLALPTHSALGRGSTLSVGQRQYAQRWAEAVCERRPADGAGHRLILSGGHNSGLPKVRSSSSLFGPPLFDEHAPCAWCFVSNPPHCISWRSARQSGDLVKLVRSAVLPGPHADVKTRCAASAQQLRRVREDFALVLRATLWRCDRKILTRTAVGGGHNNCHTTRPSPCRLGRGNEGAAAR
jgi:hypothetical protein